MKRLRSLGNSVLLIASVMFLSVVPDASGTINFHNRSSMIAMKASNSVLKVRTASQVTGWNLESIVRDFGNNASTSWVETYTNNVVVSTAGGAARTNLLYATSNAVNAGTGGSSALAIATSNALLYLIKNESNANLRMFKNNSSALLYCCKNNSNALLRLFANNSNAIVGGGATSTLARTTSNALLFLVKNESNSNLRMFASNSNALLYCCKNNSNALLRLFANNSNALLSCCKNSSNSTLRFFTNNSNAITLVNNIVQTGGGNLVIPGPTYTMTRQVVASVDSTVSVTGNTTLDGNGHVFDFTKQAGNFSVAAGKHLVFTDVVLRNYSEGAISLGAGATVTFGQGTCIELEDMQSLASNMTFSGNAVVQGFGNKIMMNNSVISVNPGGRLTLQDIFIEGLKQFNIRAQGNTASVKFKNAILCLSHDYSFTSGRILFEMDVHMVGTNTFGYRPTNVNSKILPCSKLLLDTGLTISYAPVAANRDLLGMADRSSVLYLNGCTVRSTTTGMRLTNGTLIVDHKNQFFNTGATSPSQAIAFGNGTAANDLGIEIMPGGRIQLQSGQLAYQNTN
jgi:hypothetical protein